MQRENGAQLRRGLKDGVPIMLGYFAVAFTLGITARNAGLSALQATLASVLNNASAGEYAGFQVIREHAGYWEMAAMIFVANMRYLLLSCALSQKLPRGLHPGHRFLLGFMVTDEIFALSVSVPGALNPFYTYGQFMAAMPGWALGTCLGVVMGNVLPASVVSALSVGLYGMFIAIIVPPAKKNKVLAALIPLSMALSFLVARLPLFSFLSGGTRVIVLTLLLAGGAALLCPVKEAQDGQ